MQQLITIKKQQIGTLELNSVNARDIHTYLGVKTAFSHWINRAIEKYDFKENIDFVKIDKPLNNQKDFIVSIDMAKELAMIENNPKGREARKYFISIEKEYIKSLEYPNQKFEQTLEALSQKSIEADNWKEKYLQGLERENQLLHEKINLSEHSVKKSSRLTIQEKAKIVKLHKQDYKVHEICEITNRSEAVVRKTIKLGVKDGK